MTRVEKITRNIFDRERTIVLGYCEYQELINSLYDYKIGYNSGVYGWNYDAYMVGNNVYITTGYNRPFSEVKNDLTKKVRELLNEYSDKLKDAKDWRQRETIKEAFKAEIITLSYHMI